MRYVQVGERHQITRVSDDPDHFRLIAFGKGYAFGASKAWVDAEHPIVGAWLIFGADNHWHVERKDAD
jgi:hypothetical protein